MLYVITVLLRSCCWRFIARQ